MSPWHRYRLHLLLGVIAVMGAPAALAQSADPEGEGTSRAEDMPAQLRQLLIERGIDPDASPPPPDETPERRKTTRDKSGGRAAGGSARMEEAPPVPWPRTPPESRWDIEAVERVEDGLVIEYLRFIGPDFTMLLTPIRGLVQSKDRENASVVMEHRLEPRNKLILADFPEEVFPKRIDLPHLSGYANWLAKTHGDDFIALLNERELMPGSSFLVQGRRWGYVHYRVAEGETATERVDFFIPYRGRALVIRLEGRTRWVETTQPVLEQALAAMKFTSNLD